MTPGEVLKRLESIYSRIPKMRDCKGLCHDSCTVAPCTPFEKRRIESAMGQQLKPLGMPPRLRCSALTKDGKCSQYNLRPLICRAFGAVDHPFLRCEHGCSPERWMSNAEFLDIIQEVDQLCGPTTAPEVKGWPRLSKEAIAEAARLFLR